MFYAAFISDALVSNNAIAEIMADIQSTIHAFERFKQRILPLMDLHSRNSMTNLRNFNRFLSDILAIKSNSELTTNRDIRNLNRRICCDGFQIPVTIVVDAASNRVVTIFSSPEWERTAHRMNSVWRCYA